MRKPQTDKIKTFLDGLMLTDPDKYDILVAIRERVYEVWPQITEKMMYGGVLFSNDSEMFCGIFSYKDHVTMEFSNGYLMKDPNKHLEGRGKYRRHLKFFNKADINEKEIIFYLKQAV